MSKPKYPRTEEIMVLVRKAFNAPVRGGNDAVALRYLSAAHDAVEKLEKELMKATEEPRFNGIREP